MKKTKNKKGSIGDIFILIIIIFLAAIFSIIAIKMHDEFTTAFLGNEKTNITEVNETLTDIQGAFTTVDNMIPFFIIGFAILMFALASTIRPSPAFFVLTLIIFIIAFILSVGFTNIYDVVQHHDTFVNNTVTMTYTTHIMDYLPVFVVVLGLLSLVVIYARGAFSYG